MLIFKKLILKKGVNMFLKKIFKKNIVFFTFILLMIYFLSFGNQKSKFNNYNLIQPREVGITVTIEDIDSTNFDIDNKKLPIVKGSFAWDNKDLYLVIADKDTTGLPNGSITDLGSVLWEDLYWFAEINTDPTTSVGSFANLTIAEEDPNDGSDFIQWQKYSDINPNAVDFDWNTPNEVELFVLSNKTGSRSWNLERLTEPSAIENHFITNNSDDPVSFSNVERATLESFSVVENIDQREIELNYSILMNDEVEVDVSIFSNGQLIYQQLINQNNSDNSFIITDYFTNTFYNFDFYLNNELVDSQSIITYVQDVTIPIENTNNQIIKNNYFDPEISTETNNGIINTEVVLDNPDNLEIVSTNVSLFNDFTNELISSSAGNESIDNIYAYNKTFNSLSGEITYRIEWVIQYSDGTNVKTYTSISNLFLPNEERSLPSFNFIEINNVIKPSSPNWNNGSLNVDYVYFENNFSITEISGTYNLFKDNSIIDSGDLTLIDSVASNLIFSSLEKGEYYISWDINFKVEGSDDIESISGQTNTISLLEDIYQAPSIISSDLETTKWYDDSLKGKISGEINVDNIDGIVSNEINVNILDSNNSILQMIDGVVLDDVNSKIIIPETEVLTYGDFTLELRAKQNLSSESNSDQFTTFASIPFTIEKYNFVFPELSISMAYDNEDGKLYIVFNSINGTNDNKWLDAASARGELIIYYEDGTKDEFVYDSLDMNEDFDFNTQFAQVTLVKTIGLNKKIKYVDLSYFVRNEYMTDYVEGEFNQYPGSEIEIRNLEKNKSNFEIWKIYLISGSSILGLILLFLTFYYLFKKRNSNSDDDNLKNKDNKVKS